MHFRLWVEAGSWEKTLTKYGNETLSIKDATRKEIVAGLDSLPRELDDQKREIEVDRILNQIGANQVVRELDPRVAISLARWFSRGLINDLGEHDHDWVDYFKIKKVLKRWKGFRDLPQDLKKYADKLPALFDTDPTDFRKPSDLESLNRPFLDLVKTWSDRRTTLASQEDEGHMAGAVASGDSIFKMYKVSSKELAACHAKARAPGWCVLGGSFGGYGGGPYYPIVEWPKDGEPSYVGMFIPGYLKTDSTQALRNDQNTGMMSSELIMKVRPLLEKFVPREELNKQLVNGLLGRIQRTNDLDFLDLVRIPIMVKELGMSFSRDLISKDKLAKGLIYTSSSVEDIKAGLNAIGSDVKMLVPDLIAVLEKGVSRRMSAKGLAAVYAYGLPSPQESERLIQALKLPKLIHEEELDYLLGYFAPLMQTLKRVPAIYSLLLSRLMKEGPSQYDRISAVLDLGADVNVLDSMGYRPLHWAVLEGGRGARNLVNLLLQHGADKRVVDAKGYKPIDYAMALGDKSLMDLLRLDRS